MAKYRKKSVMIEACRWEPNDKGRNTNRWPHSWGEAPEWKISTVSLALFIPTLEGEMTVQPGDWIIRGVKGEYYPCKPYIFEANYEPA